MTKDQEARRAINARHGRSGIKSAGRQGRRGLLSLQEAYLALGWRGGMAPKQSQQKRRRRQRRVQRG